MVIQEAGSRGRGADTLFEQRRSRRCEDKKQVRPEQVYAAPFATPDGPQSQGQAFSLTLPGAHLLPAPPAGVVREAGVLV